LGWAIYSSSDVARGLSCLEQATQLQPSNVNIVTDLAVAYFSSLNVRKAAEYAEKAVLIDPTNALAQDVLRKVRSFNEGFRRRDNPTERA
jgi:Tfp pilus assembly protein PilF